MIIPPILLKYKHILLIIFVLFNSSNIYPKNPQSSLSVENLSVNMLFNAEQVYINGYPTVTQLHETFNQKENFQFATISTKTPILGWIIKSEKNSTTQTAYRITVASTLDKLLSDNPDLWDSRTVNSSESSNISYQGLPLEPENVYFWRVKVWDNHGNESAFSKTAQFITAKTLTNYGTDRHPVQKQDEYPVEIEQFDKVNYFADFGKSAFGRIRINLFSKTGTDTIKLHLGESQINGRVNREPGGSIRYSQYTIVPKSGLNSYVITIKPDEKNTGSQAILIPEHIGEVTPFRYCEIENYKYPLQDKDIVRETAYYPFDETESYFISSNTILNQIWELSKYSIKATSFLGVYVDGDRERIPYEADVTINQLSHYSNAREYNMARYTHEYLINNPTWPTEWILQSVLIAWEDYKYTGNKHSLEQFYSDLKAKTLIELSDDSGFISTRTGKVTPEVMNSINYNGNIRDIVDWPHPGSFGMVDDKKGETDGFVFTDINTVVNAFHYRALELISKIAKTLEKDEDYNYYSQRASSLKKAFNEKLFDKIRGVYKDGLDTDHASLHANMFPLAFGMVDEKNKESVLEFIRLRGMACSVYGSQFLLDGIYDADDADYGLELLTSTGKRSWYNMIRIGSTITTEAWDDIFKPNQDWNHAWGSAPANIIPRKLMGIEPMEPGFSKIRIKPQPATLKTASIKYPTIKGDIFMEFINYPVESFELSVEIPANTTADIYLPYYSKKQKVKMNDKLVKSSHDNNFTVIESVGSGKWVFSVTR
ncbi:MAG: alpha-L-rhamnosidase [Fermentimonas sp.]|nr:alpha-L-rhamnosidase [Fermentimonas sp.]